MIDLSNIPALSRNVKPETETDNAPIPKRVLLTIALVLDPLWPGPSNVIALTGHYHCTLDLIRITVGDLRSSRDQHSC